MDEQYVQSSLETLSLKMVGRTVRPITFDLPYIQPWNNPGHSKLGHSNERTSGTVDTIMQWAIPVPPMDSIGHCICGPKIKAPIKVQIIVYFTAKQTDSYISILQIDFSTREYSYRLTYIY